MRAIRLISIACAVVGITATFASAQGRPHHRDQRPGQAASEGHERHDSEHHYPERHDPERQEAMRGGPSHRSARGRRPSGSGLNQLTARLLFEVMDRDNDGQISQSEFQRALGSHPMALRGHRGGMPSREHIATPFHRTGKPRVHRNGPSPGGRNSDKLHGRKARNAKGIDKRNRTDREVQEHARGKSHEHRDDGEEQRHAERRHKRDQKDDESRGKRKDSDRRDSDRRDSDRRDSE